MVSLRSASSFRGVTIKDVRSTSDSLTVEIQPMATKRYRVGFLDKNGGVLVVSKQNPARYIFKGNEGYVRARIEDSGGRRAWTQPVFLVNSC